METEGLISSGLSALGYFLPGIGAIGTVISLGFASHKAAEARREAKAMLRKITEARLKQESSSAIVTGLEIQLEQIQARQLAAQSRIEIANERQLKESLLYLGAFGAGYLLRRVA